MPREGGSNLRFGSKRLSSGHTEPLIFHGIEGADDRCP